MIDTATVARALSRTLAEGQWTFLASKGKFFNDRAAADPELKHRALYADPRESTDVCLEMLYAKGCDIGSNHKGWFIYNIDSEIPTSGPPFRKAVIELCAGEE